MAIGWNSGIGTEKKKSWSDFFCLKKHSSLKIEEISHKKLAHTNNKVNLDMFSTHCVIIGPIEYRLDFQGFGSNRSL